PSYSADLHAATLPRVIASPSAATLSNKESRATEHRLQCGEETSESAFVRADEGSCPGASDSVPSLQVHLCGHWNEGQLSVIEEPAYGEWRGSNPKENSSPSVQEQQDWGQQETPDGPGGHNCSFCPFSSLCKSKLAMHEKTHTRKCPFSCNQCQTAFTTRQDLDTENIVT
ncbi:hypothetical protein HPB47_026764, partial [Ixodes persulcatus]